MIFTSSISLTYSLRAVASLLATYFSYKDIPIICQGVILLVFIIFMFQFNRCTTWHKYGIFCNFSGKINILEDKYQTLGVAMKDQEFKDFRTSIICTWSNPKSQLPEYLHKDLHIIHVLLIPFIFWIVENKVSPP